MKILYLAILAVCSYLFGNINFAKIISRCKKDDITKHGSGNPGTLNMLRTFGFKWAIFNMTLEICKGVIPTLIAKFVFKDLGLSQIAIYVAGISVILGHIYPVFSGFKGGKGVAAFAGFSFVALPWWVALIILVVCFTFVVITSIGSIGTLGFVLISTVIQLILINPSNNGWVCYILLAFVTTLIMYVHRGNIKRLLQGKENPTNIRKAFKKDFNIKDKSSSGEDIVDNQVVKDSVGQPNDEVKVSALSVDNKSSEATVSNEGVPDNNQIENNEKE